MLNYINVIDIIYLNNEELKKKKKHQIWVVTGFFFYWFNLKTFFWTHSDIQNIITINKKNLSFFSDIFELKFLSFNVANVHKKLSSNFFHFDFHLAWLILPISAEIYQNWENLGHNKKNLWKSVKYKINGTVKPS
jgi:hypothetical protein